MFPQFDLSEAFNQVITGVVTLGSVLLGAKIAFSAGLRHLRHERALDRRLVLLETLYGLLEDYLGFAREILVQDTKGSGNAAAVHDNQRRERCIESIRGLSEKIRPLLRRTAIHGDWDFQRWSEETFMDHLSVLGQVTGQLGLVRVKPSVDEAWVRHDPLRGAIWALDRDVERLKDWIRSDLELSPSGQGSTGARD